MDEPVVDQEIRFCTTPDGVRIAFATSGAGPPLVKAANWLSHLEFDAVSPVWKHWLLGLSRDHTLVRYDERGCGLSDWEVEQFSFESWVRDLESVVDALELGEFDLLGLSQGGPVAVAYAVRHPERVKRLILYGSYARGWDNRPDAAEYREEQEALISLTGHGWGRDSPAYRQVFTGLFLPDADEEQLRWFNELQRRSTSPENAQRFLREFGRIDVRELLPRVEQPTLVLHSRGDARCPFEEGRRLAAAIPGSRFVPLDSRNHVLLEHESAWSTFLSEVRRFLGVEERVEEKEGARGEPVKRGGVAGADQAAPSGSTGEPVSADGPGVPGADPAGAGGARAEADSLLERLRQRKIVQWALAYLSLAWLASQLVGMVADPWGLSARVVRGAHVLLAAGLPVALVLAWYHGEKGRQRVSGTELLILALLLAIAGLLVAVLSP